MGVKTCGVKVNGADRAVLEQWLRAQRTPHALASRAQDRTRQCGGRERARPCAAAWSNPDHGLSVATALPQRRAGRAVDPAAMLGGRGDDGAQGAGGDERDTAQA